jgi:hypothetical protein
MTWQDFDLRYDANNELKLGYPLEVLTFNDKDFGIVFILEYVCVETERSMKSPTKPRVSTVTVGLSAFVPFDEEGFGSIKLGLINDERCSFVSSNSIFSPSNAPTCTLSFDMNKQQYRLNESRGIASPSIMQPPPTMPRHDSVSLDGSSKSLFVKKKVPNQRDEMKEDFDSFPDNSTLTFDETLIEEEGSVIADAPRVKATAAAAHQAAYGDYQSKDYSVLTEIDDPNGSTEVCICMKSFSRPEIGGGVTQEMPSSLTFQLKLYENDEVTSPPFPLKGTRFLEQSAIQFEYEYTSPDVAKRLATYMLERSLFIEVFDDSKFHIGTVALPLHLLVRQGMPRRSIENISVDVISPRGTSCDGNVVNVKEGVLLHGDIAGSISLSIALQGKQKQEKLKAEMPKRHFSTKYALNMIDTNSDLRWLVSRVKGNSDVHNPKDHDTESIKQENQAGDTNVRQRQLEAIENYQKCYEEEDASQSLLSLAHSMTPQGPHHQESLVLNATQLVREKLKMGVIAEHIAKNKPKVVSVRPLVGQSMMIELEVTNPLALDSWFAIESSRSSCIRLVTNASEWDARRRANAITLPGKESLVQFECLRKDQILMRGHQTQVLPLLLDQRTTKHETITVSLVRGNDIVTCFELDVVPVVQVDRRFHIPCRCNETVQHRFAFHPNDTNGDKAMTIKVIDETSLGVKCEWSQSKDNVYDLKLEAKVARENSSEIMYVVMSNDHFTSIVECWKVIFEARSPLYDTACLGAKTRKEITVRGGCKEDRFLICRAMVLPNINRWTCCTMCHFEKSSFQLMANQVNRMHVEFQFQAAGRWDILLNCIDEETGELVHSFILAVQCYLPVLSKVRELVMFVVDITKTLHASCKHLI